MTIYTSKKNGKSYKYLGNQIIGNKHYEVLEDLTTHDQFRATTSTLLRWYKKSVEVDFSTAKPAPTTKKASANKKADKATNSAPTTKANRVSTELKGLRKATQDNKDNNICFGTILNKIDHRVITLKEAKAEFGTVTLDRAKALIKLGDLRVRRVYANAETGDIFFRYCKELVEIKGLPAVEG